MTVSVQFINGLEEEISGISLRTKAGSDAKIVVLSFDQLQATKRLRSFTNKIDSLKLEDEEGVIQVTPSGIKFLFVDDDDMSKVECTFEVFTDSDFERVMRFFHRYAEENGFEFQNR